MAITRLGRRYIDSVIEFFEAHRNTGANMSGSACKEIAERLQFFLNTIAPDLRLPSYCAQPKRHAPGCDCQSIIDATDDDPYNLP